MDFWVKVVPNSNEDKIRIRSKNITVYVRAEARGNKANLSVVRLFSRVTHRPTKIVSGFRQRRKKIQIEIDEQELYNAIKTQ